MCGISTGKSTFKKSPYFLCSFLGVCNFFFLFKGFPNLTAGHFVSTYFNLTFDNLIKLKLKVSIFLSIQETHLASDGVLAHFFNDFLSLPVK